MNETTKTIAYSAVAGVLALAAIGTYIATKPKPIEQFALVGSEFYPDFETPADADNLQVAAFDDESGEPQKFEVARKDGVWTIPTAYDYPAEASDRLAQTASSIIGISRQALAGRREQDHEKYGVVDPLGDNARDGESVGRRVTLKSGDETLADFIVGNRVEDDELAEDPRLRAIRGEEESQPMYYVRKPDETETYIAAIELDISTKFSDWIQPDLLRMDANDIRELLIKKYQVVMKEVQQGPFIMMQGEKSKTETQKLVKESGFGSWELEGLKEDTEELETEKISSLTDGLDGLEILGVRPRFRFQGQQLLSPQLKLEIPEKLMQSVPPQELQEAVGKMQDDLADKGFTLSPAKSGKANETELTSDRGELSVATAEGLIYHLYFGKLFLGSDPDIEIGGEDKKGEDKNGKDKKSEEGSESDDDESAEGEDKNRFLLLRIEFDEERVEGEPAEPVKPTEPATPSATDSDKKPPTQPPTAESDGKPSTTPPSSDVEASDVEDENEEDSDESTCGPVQDEDGTEVDGTEVDGTEVEGTEEEGTEEEYGKEAAGEDSGEESSTDDSKTTDKAVSNTDTSEAEVAKPDKTSAEEKSTDAVDGESDDQPEADTSGGEGEEKTEEPPKPDPQAQYEQAMQQFQQDMQQYTIDVEQYKNDLKDYEAKIEEKRLKAEELTERFGAWYYIVSAENLENLRLSRSDLVKDKPAPEEEEGTESEGDADAETGDAGTADEADADKQTAAPEMKQTEDSTGSDDTEEPGESDTTAVDEKASENTDSETAEPTEESGKATAETEAEPATESE